MFAVVRVHNVLASCMCTVNFFQFSLVVGGCWPAGLGGTAKPYIDGGRGVRGRVDGRGGVSLCAGD